MLAQAMSMQFTARSTAGSSPPRRMDLFTLVVLIKQLLYQLQQTDVPQYEAAVLQLHDLLGEDGDARHWLPVYLVDQNAAPMLVQALVSSNIEVQTAAADILQKLKYTFTLPELHHVPQLCLAANSAHIQVQVAALNALNETIKFQHGHHLLNSDMVKAFLKQLKSDSCQVQAVAAEGLAKALSVTALPPTYYQDMSVHLLWPMELLLTSKDSQVQLAALHVLMGISQGQYQAYWDYIVQQHTASGETPAVSAIVRLLDSSNFTTVSHCVSILHTLATFRPLRHQMISAGVMRPLLTLLGGSGPSDDNMNISTRRMVQALAFALLQNLSEEQLYKELIMLQIPQWVTDVYCTDTGQPSILAKFMCDIMQCNTAACSARGMAWDHNATEGRPTSAAPAAVDVRTVRSAVATRNAHNDSFASSGIMPADYAAQPPFQSVAPMPESSDTADFVARLAAQLQHGNKTVQWAAMSELHKLVMDHWDWNTRSMVAKVALDGVVRALWNDSIATQVQAAEVLRETFKVCSSSDWRSITLDDHRPMGSTDSSGNALVYAGALTIAAGSDNTRVQLAAMEALTECLYAVGAWNDSQSTKHKLEVRTRVLQQMATMLQSSNSSVLAAALEVVNATLWNRSFQCGPYGIEWFPPEAGLQSLLTSSDPRVQTVAAKALGQLHLTAQKLHNEETRFTYKVMSDQTIPLVVKLLGSSNKLTAHTATRCLNMLAVVPAFKKRIMKAGAVKACVQLVSSSFSPPADISTSERACQLLCVLLADLEGQQDVEGWKRYLKNVLNKAGSPAEVTRLRETGPQHARVLARFLCFVLEQPDI